MNPNMSLHLDDGFYEQLHGSASSFAEEVFGEKLCAHAVPIATAVRSLYKDILRLEFKPVMRTNLDGLPASQALAGLAPTGSLPGLSAAPDADTGLMPDEFDDCPPRTHWGINE